MTKEACAGYCLLAMSTFLRFTDGIGEIAIKAIEESLETYSEEETAIYFQEMSRRIKGKQERGEGR